MECVNVEITQVGILVITLQAVFTEVQRFPAYIFYQATSWVSSDCTLYPFQTVNMHTSSHMQTNSIFKNINL
jgi:hypothetical protein